jgi:replicative DNA helicase
MQLRALPPQNLDAEQMVLGACLVDEIQTVAKARVRPEDFYKTAHGTIFSAMQAMRKRNEQIDLVTVAAELDKSAYQKTLPEGFAAASYLSTLISQVPTTTNFRGHEQIVIDMALRRAVIHACNEGLQSGYNLKDPDALISEIITQLNNIRRLDGNEIVPYSAIINQGFAEIERRYELQKAGKIAGIPTGIKDLDLKIHGIQPQFYLLSGASGMGKSALAHQIVRNAARHFLNAWQATPENVRPLRPDGIGVMSLEMNAGQIALRAIASSSDVPLSRLLAGTIHDADWPRLTMAAGSEHPLPIYSAFTAFSDRQIERVIDDMVQRLGCKLIVCDYLQLERVEDHNGTREQEVTKISQMHKRKIAQHGVPHIVISSLNRGLSARPDKRPTPADLRDSGNLEYDADVILFVYRDEVYNCKCPKDGECLCGRRGEAEIIIGKGRMEGTGTVSLRWKKNTTTFVDA